MACTLLHFTDTLKKSAKKQTFEIKPLKNGIRLTVNGLGVQGYVIL